MILQGNCISMRKPTIDILPECLIHKIVSYLTPTEAAPFRILSKKWLQAFLTHPNLKITLISRSNVENIDKIMERYRDEKIPIDKFEFLNFSPYFEKDKVFPCIDKWLDIALKNGIKYLSYRNTVKSSSPFPIFKFLKFLKSLVLKNCDLMQNLSLSTTDHVMSNLTTLCLSRVVLDDNMFQTLLTSCPLIVNLRISRCTRLEKIEVRSLKKIRSLTIKITYTNHPVRIQAPTLEHLYYSCPYSNLEDLDIVEYQKLKSLKIWCSKISDPNGFLEQLISRSQCLQSLILVSEVAGWFNACRSQSLRVLKLQYCRIIRVIDAPNLVSLEYRGGIIPQFKFAKESSQLKSLQLIKRYGYYQDALWFCELRKFLSNSTFFSHVSLHISDLRRDVINLEDLQMHHGVATPPVDILDVEMEMSSEYPAFVDALLWSCHPRRLNLSSPVKMMTLFMNRLMYMKNASHSTSNGSEPGFSQLKEVKAYKFDSNYQPVELEGGELAIRTLTEMEKICFLLDW